MDHNNNNNNYDDKDEKKQINSTLNISKEVLTDMHQWLEFQSTDIENINIFLAVYYLKGCRIIQTQECNKDEIIIYCINCSKHYFLINVSEKKEKKEKEQSDDDDDDNDDNNNNININPSTFHTSFKS